MLVQWMSCSYKLSCCMIIIYKYLPVIGMAVYCMLIFYVTRYKCASCISHTCEPGYARSQYGMYNTTIINICFKNTSKYQHYMCTVKYSIHTSTNFLVCCLFLLSVQNLTQPLLFLSLDHCKPLSFTWNINSHITCKVFKCLNPWPSVSDLFRNGCLTA